MDIYHMDARNETLTKDNEENKSKITPVLEKCFSSKSSTRFFSPYGNFPRSLVHLSDKGLVCCRQDDITVFVFRFLILVLKISSFDNKDKAQ